MQTQLNFNILVQLLSILATSTAIAQGTFVNLNFESAYIPTGTPQNSFISASLAVPGWTVNSLVGYDAFSAGGTLVSIFDSGVNGVSLLQGNYSAYLFGGTGSPATISQTGLVPADAQSLTAELAGSGVPLLLVSLGGQTIQMLPLTSFANYTLYGGNIAAFACFHILT